MGIIAGCNYLLAEAQVKMNDEKILIKCNIFSQIRISYAVSVCFISHFKLNSLKQHRLHTNSYTVVPWQTKIKLNYFS